MSPPINIDGNSISGITIDGQEVQEVTIDGQVAYSALPNTAQDLVAWYRFEHGDARDYTATLDGQFADSTNYSGTINGATHQSTGGVTDFKNGANSGAFDLEANNNEYIQLSQFSTPPEITVCGWMRPESRTSWGRIFDLGSSRYDYIMYSPYKDGNPASKFEIKVSSNKLNINTQNDPALGQWTHVALSYSESTSELKAYYNGQLEGSVSGFRNITSIPQTNAFIGKSHFDGDDEFDGRVDDVRIYNRILTSTEISDIYNVTKP